VHLPGGDDEGLRRGDGQRPRDDAVDDDGAHGSAHPCRVHAGTQRPRSRPPCAACWPALAGCRAKGRRERTRFRQALVPIGWAGHFALPAASSSSRWSVPAPRLLFRALA
jgi:hypothetical protein